MQLCTFIVLLQQCLYSSHEPGNDNVRSRNDVVDVDVEMMLRTADWEWEIQNRREVLMRCCKEKHTIYLSSRQEPGCFVTDVMMSPLPCHAPRYNSVTNVSWQLYCRWAEDVTMCSICLHHPRDSLSLSVTRDIPRMGQEECGQPSATPRLPR